MGRLAWLEGIELHGLFLTGLVLVAIKSIAVGGLFGKALQLSQLAGVLVDAAARAFAVIVVVVVVTHS